MTELPGKPDLTMMNVLELALLRKELRDFKAKHGENKGDEVWLRAVEDECQDRAKRLGNPK